MNNNHDSNNNVKSLFSNVYSLPTTGSSSSTSKQDSAISAVPSVIKAEDRNNATSTRNIALEGLKQNLKTMKKLEARMKFLLEELEEFTI